MVFYLRIAGFNRDFGAPVGQQYSRMANQPDASASK
jgi:hypothetical protein